MYMQQETRCCERDVSRTVFCWTCSLEPRVVQFRKERKERILPAQAGHLDPFLETKVGHKSVFSRKVCGCMTSLQKEATTIIIQGDYTGIRKVTVPTAQSLPTATLDSR